MRPNGWGSARTSSAPATAADLLLGLRLRAGRSLRGKKAYDLLVQCEAGLLSVAGTPDEPCKAGISVADIAAGMYAYSGVLTALYERERTGRGSSFEVSLLDALGEWMSQPYYYTVYGQHEARRTGARHASISPYGPYLGGQVFLGLQNEREWAVLCERVLRRPDLVTQRFPPTRTGWRTTAS